MSEGHYAPYQDCRAGTPKWNAAVINVISYTCDWQVQVLHKKSFLLSLSLHHTQLKNIFPIYKHFTTNDKYRNIYYYVLLEIQILNNGF